LIGAGEHANGEKAEDVQTSLGFYDLAIAAPSMKAALEAWGARSNLFHQGVAKEVDDPDVVDATMAKPGVVLCRRRDPAGASLNTPIYPPISRRGERREEPLEEEASAAEHQ
jgi:hypothetical protein